MNGRVTATIEGGIADVRLTRADKMNAIDDAMFDALIQTGERLKTEAGVRAVVLSGEGRAFCAGLDIDGFQSLAAGAPSGVLDTGNATRERTPGGAHRVQQAVMVWREVPVPVIVALHGVAFGGGFQLALGADLRFVAPDAKLSVLEIKWGLVPDMGGIVLLRGLVRDDVARELTWSGRTFTGEEAGRLGIATRVVANPLEDALAFAHEIAGKSPHAIRAGKRLLNLAVDGDQHGILLEEAREQVALIGSPNQMEAVMANLEKRQPKFAEVATGGPAP